MNAHKKGTRLKIEIRLALSALGRPVDSINLSKLRIVELEQLRKELHSEWRAARAVHQIDGRHQ